MSVGGLVGAVAGGVTGFFIGGPLGAFYGASLGFALGMAIDPITPDMPSAGAPDQGDQVMSGKVGTPIADLAGTAKIVGHLLCYGGERAEPVYGKPSGGGGKGGGGGGSQPEPQITGYKYYMSWAVGIVAGEADTLYAVYKNDEVVWEGELNCPASGGQETIVLDGMGSATLYFGTDDHALNPKVGALLDDPSLNTPYRHLCWCFLDDCYIGEYNRAPTMKFVVKKIPEYAFSTKHEIDVYDCNPAHAIWYILHDLTGLPESWLHSTDFAAIATTLKSELRGLSILFSSQQSALNYLESINSHIDNILRYGTDGKFHPKLIRDDYTIGDLPTIDEDVMLEEPTFDRRSWIDTVNEMKVQYSEIIDVTRCVKDPTMAWDEGTSAETIDREDLVTVAVTGLNFPFTWSVSGAGFTLDEEETEGLTNTLNTDDSACGSATITVTGCDGVSIVGYVRCTFGEWVHKPVYDGECLSSGGGSYIGDAKYHKIYGNKKLVQSMAWTDCTSYPKRCNAAPTCPGIDSCTYWTSLECLPWDCELVYGATAVRCNEACCNHTCGSSWGYCPYISEIKNYEWEC